MIRRPSFLDKDPPPGYIPGIGRGASGFSTRADVGTGRLAPQHRRGDGDDEEDHDGRYADVDENGMLIEDQMDKEDEEADEIYKAVEERLRLRHKKRVRLDDADDIAGERGNLAKISKQFVDLKKELSTVSDEQWANLPEVGDLTKRNKRLRDEANRERLQFAAPDSLIGGLGEGVDISKLTSERQKLLGSKIDANFELEDNVIDQEGYLQEVSALETGNEEEMKHIKSILSSYTKADPSKSTGWIARARLEEFNKNFEQAKKLIEQGCANCPRDEDIWLESVRIHRTDLKYCKIIITEGVRFNPKSVKLWLKAAELEQDDFNKRRVLRKAIEAIPTCEELWSRLVSLEDSGDESVKILTKALEFVPKSESLWLELIDAQSYKDARSTLNKARKALGNDNVEVWLKAIRLEFEHGEVSKVEKLIKKAFKECPLTRDEWYSKAIEFGDGELTHVAALIVKELLNAEDADYSLWVSDTEKYSKHAHIVKAILDETVIRFPKKTSIWRKLIEIYKEHFSVDDLYNAFERALDLMPKTALFWLMYSKEVWKNGDIDKAQSVLHRAVQSIPHNVDVWCALMKLQAVSHSFSALDDTFERSKTSAPSERLWFKFVHVLRQRGLHDRALTVLNQGLQQYSDSWKMYLQKAQILESRHDLEGARQVLSLATRTVPTRPELWIYLSDIDLKLSNTTRARSSLDIGLAKCPGDLLWLAKLDFETLNGDRTQVGSMLSRALREYSESSLLWKFKLEHFTKRTQRKAAYQDALQATSNHVRILLVIGANFYREGKLDKAQRWFERSVETDTDFGDAYGWLYKTLKISLAQGVAATTTADGSTITSGDSIESVERRCLQAEPRHGDVWPVVSKDVGAPSDPVQVLYLVAERLH